MIYLSISNNLQAFLIRLNQIERALSCQDKLYNNKNNMITENNGNTR